ncbi:MAG: class II aldolase/adducin family protein [Fimbriimonas sp.]
MTPALQQLVHLANAIGQPTRDQTILGEGNASALEDADSFWVKASGFSMTGIEASGFVRVNLAPVLETYAYDVVTDEHVREVLLSARADANSKVMPSVETFFHAWLLSLPDISFVGHSHATPVLSLLCLEDAEEVSSMRLFPDEVVCCGPASAFVPYVDPGLPLAQAIRQQVLNFADTHGALPRTIMLKNHGIIAAGKTPREVESALFMAEKAARVKLAALGLGLPISRLSDVQIDRIHTRPDEHHRQRLLWQMQQGRP